MKRWHLKAIEIQPLAKRILAIYFNGHEQWVKHFSIEDSCIPTTIDEKED